MWAPDFTIRPAESPDAAIAILPFAVQLKPTDKSPTRIKLVPYGLMKDKGSADSWTLSGKVQAAEAISVTRTFQRGIEMLVDFDHQSVLSTKGSSGSAAGSISPGSLTSETDGIYADIVWTMVALAAIAAKEYAYIEAHVVAERGTGKITRLLGAGLTNSPQGDIAALASQASLAANVTAEERAICAALGLPVADFAEQKVAGNASGLGKLSLEQSAICAAVGVSEASFLAAQRIEAGR